MSASLLAALTAHAQLHADPVRVFLLAEELEVATLGGQEPWLLAEGEGWVGGDVNRAWVRFEGEQRPTEPVGTGELEAFYGRLIAPWWDLLIGARVDGAWGEDGAVRPLLAVGLQGLAPYRFEVAPTLYLDPRGDLLARLEASTDLLITQRLILEPEIEVDLALAGLQAFGVSGRLRYEIVRELAPYVGVAWTLEPDRRVGSVLLGVRAWR